MSSLRAWAKKLLVWGGVGLTFSGAAYFLWWLHNDYPYGACLIAAVLYVIHLRFVGWMITETCERDFRDAITSYDEHREARLDAKFKALYRRLDEDEQKLDELEVDDE